MNWNVTFRDSNGSRVTSLFKAESRSELFKILSEKKINAISISKEAVSNGLPFLGIPVYILSITVCLAICVTTVLMLSSISNDNRETEKIVTSKKRQKFNAYTPRTYKTNSVTMAKSTRDPNIISIRKTINPFTGEEMMLTNRHKKVKANAGVINHESLSKNKHKPKRKLFKYYSENYICGLMRTPLGMPIVRGRLPKNFDEDFAKSYKETIKVEPEDTDEDIALKQAMIDFKEEIRELIAKGASVSEMVLQSREEVNKLAEYRKNLMRTISDLRREGASKDELTDARKAANIMLDEKGLKRIPSADLPRIGEEL